VVLQEEAQPRRCHLQTEVRAERRVAPLGQALVVRLRAVAPASPGRGQRRAALRVARAATPLDHPHRRPRAAALRRAVRAGLPRAVTLPNSSNRPLDPLRAGHPVRATRTGSSRLVRTPLVPHSSKSRVSRVPLPISSTSSRIAPRALGIRPVAQLRRPTAMHRARPAQQARTYRSTRSSAPRSNSLSRALR